MDERTLHISLVLAAGLGALQIALLSWRSLSRRRLALRVNQPLSTPPLPTVEGTWRDVCCGAFVGSALGESTGASVRNLPRALAMRVGHELDVTRKHAWRPVWRPGRYALTTQLMMAAARAVEDDGQLNLRRYRLEIAFLHRYAVQPSGAVASAARRYRAGRARPTLAQRVGQSGEAAIVGVPVGLVWAHDPGYAAQLAAKLAGQTHERSEVRQAAALVAAATARLASMEPGEKLQRRQLLDQIGVDAGGPEGAAAIAIKPAADLAARPLEENLQRLRTSLRVLDVLPLAFYLALRFDRAPQLLLEVLPRLGRQAPVAGAIAMALVSVRSGLAALEGLPLLDALQDRDALEILGERMSVLKGAPRLSR